MALCWGLLGGLFGGLSWETSLLAAGNASPGGRQEGTGISVYVGSYTDASSAERVRQRLVAMGFPAFLHEAQVSGKPFVRVYGGPLASRDEVEHLLETVHARMGIRGIAVTGLVVRPMAPAAPAESLPEWARPEPAPARPSEESLPVIPVAGHPSARSAAPEVPATPATPAEGIPQSGQQYMVQLFSLSSRANVEATRSRLAAIQISSFVEDVKVNNKILIRLSAGPFASEAQARRAADQIRSQLNIAGEVRRYR
jgi:cell division septation protein DedD